MTMRSLRWSIRLPLVFRCSFFSTCSATHPLLTWIIMERVDILALRLVVRPPTLIFVVDPLYISIIPSITAVRIPFLLSRFRIDQCKTKSNPFARSRNTVLYSYFLFLYCLMMFWRIFTFLKHPSTGTKSFCLSSNLTFALSRLSHTFAYSLIKTLLILIGRQCPTSSLCSTVWGRSVVLYSLASSGF